jgi:valine dehydrogenase (NAD+)
VGRKLVDHLVDDGAEVVICDVSEAATDSVRARHPGVEIASGTAELLAAGLDVFSPCALGGAVDDDVAATLSAAIICGGANNQLAHAGVEKLLADRGILYAPDYVVNAGGVIQVADERDGFSFERAKARAEQIFTTTTRIFEIAESDGVPSSTVADRLAEQRMSDVGRLRGIWLGG